MPVKKFIGGGMIKREALLRGKAVALMSLVENFLKEHRFWTEWGIQTMNATLAKVGIENSDDSVVAFAQDVVGDCIGLLCFQTGEDDYEFVIVSGSEEELMRMSRD